MNSSGFTLYEIYEINELSVCHRTDTDRLGRGILMVGVPSGRHRGWGTGDGRGVVSGTDASANFGPSASSATPKSAWNFGI